MYCNCSLDEVSIFPSVRELFDVHNSLLAKLRSSNSSSDRMLFVSHLLRFATDPKVADLYSAHVVRLELARPSLDKFIKSRPQSFHFIQSVISENQCISGLEYLSSLLISSTQRLGRYPLLMREILRVSNPLFPDFEGFETLLESFKLLAETANYRKKIADSDRRKLFLQNHSSTVEMLSHDLKAKYERSVKLRFCKHCEKVKIQDLLIRIHRGI